MMSTAILKQHWRSSQRQALLLLSLFAFNLVSAVEVGDKFCRRYFHQSTVIDDKLYIDGGYMVDKETPQTQENRSNTDLGYHDLNTLANVNGEGWPEFYVGLNKNDSIPTVAGGILWPDSVNKRFYLYGGERTTGTADSNDLLSYDIINDKWDNLGQPGSSLSPNMSAFGAGVGVSATGMGYYYGGWISDKTTFRGPKEPEMSSEFYSYDYDDDSLGTPATPDNLPRAEGGMVWIPAGDAAGLLVYLGGVVSLHGNDTSPQSLEEIFVFDAAQEQWYTQNATGDIPSDRGQFCMDVAWPSDKSSFNIYLWGGQSVDGEEFGEAYILTLPSFTWIKIFPANKSDTNTANAKYGSTCNMVKDMSQFFVIGGKYPDSVDTCDFDEGWGQHDLWTGTANNTGDSKDFWYRYDKDFTGHAVPSVVYDLVGGDKNGGATLKKPDGDFSSDLLGTLMGRRTAQAERKATRKTPGSSKLGPGAIAGIAVGGAVVLVLVVYLWYRFGNRVVQRRKERRQQEVTQQVNQIQAQQAQQALQAQQAQHDQHVKQAHQSFYGGSTVGGQSIMTPQSPVPAHWEIPGSPVPGSPDMNPPPMAPTELPADNGTGTNYKPPASPGSPYRH